MASTLRIDRPTLLDERNNKRSIYQRARKSILDEDFDELMLEWIAENAGEGTTHRMGIPDTAMNPIASNTRQLVTPGLYGRAPKLTYSDAAEPLLGKRGVFDLAGFWQRSQSLQYYTVGVGIYFRLLNIVDIGNGSELVDLLIEPGDVVVFTRDENPMCPYAIWRLRTRLLTERGKSRPVWVWDQYSVEDPANPFFRVVRADYKGEPKEDLTAEYVREPDVYPWKDPEGAPFLPWVTYRSVDGGSFWPHHRRGMHRGTLRACEHWTYTSRAALFATGEHVLIGGADQEALPGVATKRGDDNIQQSATPQLSMEVTPGMMTFIPNKQGEPLTSIKIGPGVNLPNLFAFANGYNMNLAINDGLHPTDATRQSANPTSGAALEISNESRREYSDQIKPFAMNADLECIHKVSWMFASIGINYPVDDVTISYHTIPLSPMERKDLRDDLEWQEGQGIISPVDVYLTLNPGATRDQARRAVIEARVEKAEIDKEVSKQTGIPVMQAPDPSLQRTQDEPAPKPSDAA